MRFQTMKQKSKSKALIVDKKGEPQLIARLVVPEPLGRAVVVTSLKEDDKNCPSLPLAAYLVAKLQGVDWWMLRDTTARACYIIPLEWAVGFGSPRKSSIGTEISVRLGKFRKIEWQNWHQTSEDMFVPRLFLPGVGADD